MQLVITNRTLSVSLLAAVAVIAAAGLVWFLAGGTPSTAVQAQEKVTVDVGDIWYCSPDQVGVCEITIDVGDSITWDFTSSELPHTVTECGASCDDPTATPLWDSGLIGPASLNLTYEVQFDQAGTFLYYCQVHPFAQLGRIVVEGAPTGIVGDANCDESVTSVDSLLILQFVAGLLNSLSCAGNADVNDDGSANAIDSALILQRVAGLIPEL